MLALDVEAVLGSFNVGKYPVYYSFIMDLYYDTYAINKTSIFVMSFPVVAGFYAMPLEKLYVNAKVGYDILGLMSAMFTTTGGHKFQANLGASYEVIPNVVVDASFRFGSMPRELTYNLDFTEVNVGARVLFSGI